MKRNLTIIAGLMFMVLSLSSFAKENFGPLKGLSSKHVVMNYVKATTLGEILYNEHLFTDDFEYTNTANKNKINKKDYVKFLSANKDLKFDCETKYEVLDQTGKTAIAKATMAFDNFTRVDIITLSLADDEWKISNIVSTYK